MVGRGLAWLCTFLLTLMMTIPAFAASPYHISMTGPEEAAEGRMIVGIDVEDAGGIGWQRVTATTTADGMQYDLTEALRQYDRVGIEITANTDIVVEVVAPDGGIYTDSRRAMLFEEAASPEVSGQAEAELSVAASPASEQSEPPIQTESASQSGAPPMPTDGTASVIDNAVADSMDREFFTFQTPLGSVFYLIVDRNKESENVFFLNAVTERDLLDLAEGESWASEPEQSVSEPEPDPPSEESVPDSTPEQEPQRGSSPLLLVAIVVVVGAGLGWYLKVYRPKRRAASGEEYTGDEPIPYDGGDYEEWDDDAPWDDGEAEQ